MALDPGPDERRAGRAGPAEALDATPETAAVRWAVIGPPSRIAREARRGSFMTTTAQMAGSPRAVLSAKPVTQFIPSRSPVSPPSRTAQVRRHRMRERAVLPRMHADLRRQLRVAAERDHRPLGQLEALLDRRHRGEDVGRRQVAQGRGGHAPPSLRGPTRSGHPARPNRGQAHYHRHGPDRCPESLENLKLERDAIVLYDALAGSRRTRVRAGAFQPIAGNERRHAEIWATKLRELGADVPASRAAARAGALHHPAGPALRDERRERPGQGARGRRGGRVRRPGVARGRGDRRRRARARRDLERLRLRRPAWRDAAARRRRPRRARHAGAPDARRDRPRERWHRTGQSGTLRAVIFGVSDGLVSNLSLVMGVAGAAPPSNPRFILLAGIAGLLAGSFSMAAGEYISMQSQRELYERQIALERAELEAMPDEEEAELARIYRSKGFSAEEAGPIAHRIFRDPEAALDTLDPRGARARPRPARLALGRGRRVVRGVRGRGEHPGHPVPVRRRRGRVRGQPRREPGRRCSRSARGQPPDRARPVFSGARQLFIGLAAAVVTFADRQDHRRRGLTAAWATRLGRSRASGPRAWTRLLGQRAGRSLRAARARLRQGAGRRRRLDRVRAAGRARPWT